MKPFQSKRWKLARLMFVVVLSAAFVLGPASEPSARAETRSGKVFTEAERAQAVQYARETRRNLLDAVSGLTDEQWNFRQGPDRWTIAEILEHVVIVESGGFDTITNRILKTPPVAEAKDGGIDARTAAGNIAGRERKFQAPEMFQPTGRFGPGTAVLDEFGKARAQMIQFMTTTSDDLRLHVGFHPALRQEADAYVWFMTIMAHTERHLKQINEVKNDPNFPKSTDMNVLTEKDRAFLKSYFTETLEKLRAEVSGLSDEQWNYRSGPDRWTIAEVVEHITVAEKLIVGRALQMPVREGKSPYTEEMVLALARDRTRKFQAPEVIKPTGRWMNSTEVMGAFEKTRADTLAFIATAPDDLRRRFAPHPVFKEDFDGYLWMVTISAHCERHTAQIREVKADPNFPR